MASSPKAASRREQDHKPEKVVPTSHVQLLLPHLFASMSVGLLALYQWPLRWFISGAPILSYVLLLGSVKGTRILPFVNTWTLLTIINAVYTVAATSWLLYWIFAFSCFQTVFVASLYQFDSVATVVRKQLRNVLRTLQFTSNKIAFFDLPALEIDVDVEGLMVIRGVTFSLSSLTIVVHGVEVGIKFSDDMELAIVTDKVTVSLFRRIDIGDVYGNLKGGEYEMNFGKLAAKSKDENGEPIMVTDTPLLAAAAKTGHVESVTMVERMTGGESLKPSSIKSGFESVKELSDEDQEARQKYHDVLDYIEETSVIHIAHVEAEGKLRALGQRGGNIMESGKDLRAAVCTILHEKPTIAHPPKRAIKVSTIKNVFPKIRKFLHRFPLLLRAQLNPIAYFHPIFIESITAGGSGRWGQHMLSDLVFKDYADDNMEIRRLKKRVSAWLTDANFVLELGTITGLASVPMNTEYDITSHLTFNDIMAYRTLPLETDLAEVFRLGGADATVRVPSYLLPHHEHLLPPPPSKEDIQKHQEQIDTADGQPKTLQAEHEMMQLKKDETNIKISAHVHLPACLDQTLLDFIALLVKATKIVELQAQVDSPLEEDNKGIREFGRMIKAELKDKMHKTGQTALDVVANDRWIAKLIGKLVKRLETMQGDVGYSGDLPVALEVYRKNAELASKIMP